MLRIFTDYPPRSAASVKNPQFLSVAETMINAIWRDFETALAGLPKRRSRLLTDERHHEKSIYMADCMFISRNRVCAK